MTVGLKIYYLMDQRKCTLKLIPIMMERLKKVNGLLILKQITLTTKRKPLQNLMKLLLKENTVSMMMSSFTTLTMVASSKTGRKMIDNKHLFNLYTNLLR